jgi:D-sedoheptulose 7-phosphate isomerase
LSNYIEDSILDLMNVLKLLASDVAASELIKKISISCISSIRSNGKIIFCGNGSSYADAQNLSALFISRFEVSRNPFSSCCLGSNGAGLTAVGNDYGFEKIFSRELLAIGKKSDLLICLSTSGNSKNILEVTAVAKELGIPVFGICGDTSGKLFELCECLLIPSQKKPRIQEASMLVGHIILGLIEQGLISKNKK